MLPRATTPHYNNMLSIFSVELDTHFKGQEASMQLLMIVLTVLGPLSPQPSWESRLRNPEARHPALVRMLALDTHKTDLTDPQSVSQTLLKVVFSTEAAQADRLLAIRTLGHLRLKMAANALAPLTVLHRSPMDKAMAQEAVSALAKICMFFRARGGAMGTSITLSTNAV